MAEITTTGSTDKVTVVSKLKSMTLETWYNIAQALGVGLVAVTFLVGLFGFVLALRIKKDDNAKLAAQELRIAELNNETQSLRTDAEIAKSERAEADKQIAIAKAGASKANEETARLNVEAENAKKALAEANAQIAQANEQIEIAKANALRAKEGIADAEARSLDASAEVARLNITVANAEIKRLEAEKALFELQERAKDRHLTLDQRSKLLDVLSNELKGDISIRCAVSNDPEPCNFAQEFASVFVDAGWRVQMDSFGLVSPPPTDRGVTLWVHITPEKRDAGVTSIKVPVRVGSIRSAFKAAGLQLEPSPKTHVSEGQLVLYVGPKL